MKSKKNWGFDTSAIDKNVRPQDDFYHFANGTWVKRTKIPAEEASWGSFSILRYKTDHQLKTLVDALLKKKTFKLGSHEQLVVDLYRSAVDIPLRNKLGIKPLQPWLTKVAGTKNIHDLVRLIAELHKVGSGVFWGTGIEQDFKNTSVYKLYMAQGGLGMPDRDYYLRDEAEYKRVRDAYIKHMQNILKLAGLTKTEITNTVEVSMRIETRLAQASMRKEEMRDPEKIYHKKNIASLKQLSPSVDWTLYLKDIQAQGLKDVVVMQPVFFKEISALLTDTPIEDLRTYMLWHVIGGFSGLLSEKFVKENFKWTQVLMGQKKMKPLWRRGLGTVNGNVDEALGKLYADAYFDKRSKDAMDELVTDLFVVCKQRIAALDWMGAATKRKALQKLKAMTRKIAYPKKYETYKGLVVKREDYFGNILRAQIWNHNDDMRKVRKPVDRSEWITTPQTVNAFYNPLLNDINFPAAILQAPFFDLHADAAVNYAGIGSVIGHEITHGFDDEGSKFDGNGNLKSWWQKDDRARFMRKANLLVEQYNAYEVAPGVNTNGKLTLGENIADLGGLTIGWDAYQLYLKKYGGREIDGFTPQQRFFLGFALMEQRAARESYRKMQALTDPHAEASQRVNGPLANFDPFYETFSVKKSDKLWRDPKKRAKIW